jgi:hypothetical protein
MSRLRVFLAFSAALALVACAAAAPTKKHRDPVDPGDEFGLDDSPEEQPLNSDTLNDSGAFGANERPKKDKDAGPGKPDATVDAGPTDDGGTVTRTYCTGALAVGDVIITELMIAARAGAADDGEWIEVTSTRDCWLKMKGVSIESPRGAVADSVNIDEDFDLAPHDTFLVADSLDPAVNHALPGKVFAWGTTDVLKNSGDTVSVKSGATVIDTLTYPAFSNLTPGRSIAFPDDCMPGDRADWQRWSLTFDSWTDGFEGTPNATNADVACY